MDIRLWTKALIIAYYKAHRRVEKLKLKADCYIKSCFGSNRDAEVELATLYGIISNCKRIEYLINIFDEIMAKHEGEKIFCIMFNRYKDEMSFVEIAAEYNLNIRTVFRKCDKAFAIISEELLDMGIDEYRCEELWGDDILIRSIIKLLCDKRHNKRQQHFTCVEQTKVKRVEPSAIDKRVSLSG